MTIADRIRNRRLELGLSVDDLAKKLNKNRATVYRYESSYIKSYSPRVLESLARALETTPAYFYGYEESDDSDSDPTPASSETVHLLINGVKKLPPEQQEQALNVMRAVFAQYKDYFERGEKENDS